MPSLALFVFFATLAHVYAASNAGATVTLFLPMAKGSNVAASIVTEAPNATVYAIGCLQSKSACAGGCTFDQSITVTEGPSTLRYTWTDVDRAFSVANHTGLIHPVTTVACDLLGVGTASGTNNRATQAICTASSSVYPSPHAGKSSSSSNGTRTMTLKSSQIEYVAVTVTGQPASSTASGTKTTATTTAASSGGSGPGASASANAQSNGAGVVSPAMGLPAASYAVALGLVLLGSFGILL